MEPGLCQAALNESSHPVGRTLAAKSGSTLRRRVSRPAQEPLHRPRSYPRLLNPSPGAATICQNRCVSKVGLNYKPVKTPQSGHTKHIASGQFSAVLQNRFPENASSRFCFSILYEAWTIRVLTTKIEAGMTDIGAVRHPGRCFGHLDSNGRLLRKNEAAGTGKALVLVNGRLPKAPATCSLAPATFHLPPSLEARVSKVRREKH